MSELYSNHSYRGNNIMNKRIRKKNKVDERKKNNLLWVVYRGNRETE